MNNKETIETHKKNQVDYKGNKTNWENIQQYSGPQSKQPNNYNNKNLADPTGMHKNIYRDRYDYSDVEQNSKDFKSLYHSNFV